MGSVDLWDRKRDVVGRKIKIKSMEDKMSWCLLFIIIALLVGCAAGQSTEERRPRSGSVKRFGHWWGEGKR